MWWVILTVIVSFCSFLKDLVLECDKILDDDYQADHSGNSGWPFSKIFSCLLHW